MAFGRGRSERARSEAPPPPLPPEQVDWRGVRTFVLGMVWRPHTPEQPGNTFGDRAIRVPMGTEQHPVNVPCAYAGSDEETASRVAGAAFTLYEDAAHERLLCSVMGPVKEGRTCSYEVRDATGTPVGTLSRVAGGRFTRHTWRIDQPGHPQITGAGEITSAPTRTEKAFVTAARLVAAAIPEAEGVKTKKPRTLYWMIGDQEVMLSEASKKMTITADWLDRRLAFAFPLIGDDDKPRHGAATS
ncbi:hypothetical protein OHB02_12020 [Streptomyces albidoflavus]|uniref:hypothetical protein n=1 Tax=Streptomyces TaxID=1883 RepID=UPI00055EC9F2|nr:MULTISPECIES: hypothetical protein [unclassified Streptomyces]WDV32601.1 hypothetical protein OIM90_18795 [Streptomyces sp. AD16]WSB20900.1 hypothetical protein OHB02_12020 [Streptomyces albidoflavus]